MRRARFHAVGILVALGGCGTHRDVAPADFAAADGATAASADASTAPTDAGTSTTDGGFAIACQWSGAQGTCLTTAACAAIADRTSEPGSCTGAATIQCCIDTPNVADNPPPPMGYKLMAQSQVTPSMTTWAVMILHDPVTYPMYATATQTFGALTVLARVEWHPPDFQNGAIHRGVTLYVPV